MTLMLDTSILIDIEKGSKETLEKLQELSLVHSQIPVISFMTYVEFLIGMETVGIKKRQKLQEIIMNFHTTNTTKETALLLSRLKYQYDKQGNKKSLTDLFIASQAIEHNLTLVTRDKDFAGITELKSIIF